jgi:hypothetical protein
VTPVPTVDVTVANVTGLGGYEAWISYDSSVVQLKSLTDSGFLENQGQNLVVCDGPTITPGYGYLACSILAALTPVPPSAGATPVPIVHAAFVPVAHGTSALGLTALASGTPETTMLLDINNTPIGASLGGGNITVPGASASVGGIAERPDVAALKANDGGFGARRDTLAIAMIAASLLLTAAAAGRRLFHGR